MENMEAQDRVVHLVDSIMAILAGADVAEADTALSLAVAVSICALAPNDTTMRYRALEGFTRVVSEFLERRDIIDWIEASIAYAPPAERA